MDIDDDFEENSDNLSFNSFNSFRDDDKKLGDRKMSRRIGGGIGIVERLLMIFLFPLFFIYYIIKAAGRK